MRAIRPMTEPSAEPPEVAWQPLTPRGVAAFARAPFSRLVLALFVIALLSAGTAGWLVHTAWFPVVSKAIGRMPSQGEIRAGWLDWQGDSPQTLAENRFLALTVDLRHEGDARSPAHVQLEFGRTDVTVFSLLGSLTLAYPRGWVIRFNREELMPWWGAWAPAILAVVIALGIAVLMLIWALLATVYCPLVWLAGFIGHRELSLRQSRRFASAALMPGALLMCGVIVVYGLGKLDVVQLLAAVAAHFAVGWIYLILGPFYAPKPAGTTALQENPFANAASKRKRAGESNGQDKKGCN
jgi:hypothetical protein